MTTLSRTIRRRLPRDIERRQWVGLMSGAGVAFRRVRSPRVTPVVPWEQIWLAAMKLSAEELRRARLEKRARRK